MIENPHSYLPFAYRAAARVVQSPLLAEEAGERAVHQFTIAVLQGDPPAHPWSWLRCVAKRSALALLRSHWARQRNLDDLEPDTCPMPYAIRRGAGWDFVREALPRKLSQRQRQALAAAVTCNSTRDAARACGMQPRDFRRSLNTITRKARDLLATRRPVDALADNPEVQSLLDG
ncbi:MAG: hypothetical protein WAT39_03855 [Planctomycetota bacterium]